VRAGPVLAPLWKFATGLLILCGEGHEAASVREIWEFVCRLLLLRRGSPLDTCVLNLLEYEDEDIPLIEIWIRHVLMCKVQVLSLDIRQINNGWDPWFGLGNLPLVSQNVKRLKLGCVQLNDSFLDFSSCPALEVLEFDCCQFLDCHRISSQSLKFLSFRNQFDYERISRTHIYAPHLISLWLEASDGWIPLLERMPSLVEAVVKIKFSDDSYCLDCEDEDCSCYPVHGDTADTVVLQGLSEAQSLVLMSDIRVVCLHFRLI